MDNEEQQQAVQPEVPQQQPEFEGGAAATRPAADENISVTDSIKEALAENAQSSETSAPTDQRGGEDAEKKTRYERRVEGLIDKLKTVTQQQPDVNSLFGNDPIFTPEEIESGQFDPQALAQRLEQREQRVQQVAAQQAVAAVEYKSAITDHLNDIDAVQKELGGDPVLDKLVAKQYDALNHQTDPRTGMKVFVPQVKMSEIYKEFKEALDKKSTAAAADVQAKLTESATNQAVPVSVSNSPTPDYEAQEAYSKASQSGQLEDWAEVLKKRMK